jgi:predicted nucleotide-binding protein (sugar kinase/HSP70/actin superfamily)
MKFFNRKTKRELNKGLTLYIPHYFDHVAIVAACLRHFGVKTEVLDIAGKEDLHYGRKYLLGKECLACTIATSGMIKKIKTGDFDPKCSAFWCIRMGGPCRVGQYRSLQEMLINEISGTEDHVTVYKNPAGFHKPAEIFEHIDLTKYEKMMSEGSVAFDLICKAMHETRPYEKHKGQTYKAYEECKTKICETLEAGGDMVKTMQACRGIFERVEADKGKRKIRIGLTGMVFYIYNNIANNNIITRLEDLGVEVSTPMAVEIVLYELLAIKNIFELKNEKMKAFTYKHLLKLIEKKIRKLTRPWDSFLSDYKEPPIEELVNTCNQYIDKSVVIETILSIGRAKYFIENGLSGVILLKSFSCMPGAIAESIIGKSLKKDTGDFPFIAISFDALEETNIQTTLEAFVYQTEQFARQNQR